MVPYSPIGCGLGAGSVRNSPEGPAQVRQALARLVDLGVRTDVGFFSGLLAEFEAETLGATSGLARIDDALRLATQTENRFALSFLHRLRGEILLKRDPSEPTPAEEAFHRALPSHASRARAASAYAPHCRWPGSTNLPAAPPRRTLFSNPPSEGFRRRPKCPRSLRRRRCWWLSRPARMVRHE